MLWSILCSGLSVVGMAVYLEEQHHEAQRVEVVHLARHLALRHTDVPSTHDR